jgi:hypothetical protein
LVHFCQVQCHQYYLPSFLLFFFVDSHNLPHSQL